MSLLSSLVTGLDDDTRSRTLDLIARSVAEERAAAAEGNQRRAADVGTRSRRSRDSSARR
ncbi:hypothetical protein I6A84_30470 [Frankia sp. CNm7]|uniref:Uncharacterized protein n=1 Tax=Frankia nepalensis TaxID=1836974 RepID=A0A937RJ34_9ACTN|nr:hypothetical protein [Frankia nepalensis]MBL7497185.1 hypothetical protein [Frankia nepalensis]MBL7515083.1 hypothetical protein [Frankia nepalensis]MBL7522288.1 hypothetical protein [Frankia nepalensis]MBL7626891.1 hypothetical protein [Frankia nepalensis]